jgi:SNF2 family DNA or RNA helicase
VIAHRLIKGGLKKVVTYDGRNSRMPGLNLADAADAIVLQIQTGCEGLNLQANFSEIYFVSPHWNPCVEDQAIARCHRIGQTKPTYVFKFAMLGFTKREDDKTEDVKDIKDPQSLDPQSLETYVNKVQTTKRNIIGEIIRQ